MSPIKLFIFHLVLQKPRILLHEITQELGAVLGVSVTESAVCKVLSIGGFTHQKLTICALQRNDSLQEQFKADISLHTKESFV